MLCDILGAVVSKKEQVSMRTIRINNIQDKQIMRTNKLGTVKK
jgi:hypothetical protein